MQLEKVYELNENELMVPCHSPDTDSVTIRAIETETIQTTTAKFYILNKSDNSIKSVYGLSTEVADTLKQDINAVILAEIDKANSYLNVFGITLDVSLEILLPHETTSIVEVPTISSYQDLLERETIAYLTNAGALIVETIERKQFINAAIVKLKSTPLWDAMDVITILPHSFNWDSLKRNVNLKTAVPSAWRNRFSGGSDLTTGIEVDGNVGTFINLGYQPLASDFNNYFPNPQYTVDNASFTIKIAGIGAGNGCVFSRSNHQDLLSYDPLLQLVYINISGTYEYDGVVEYSFEGDFNGTWTINRIDSSNVEIYKDGVLLDTVNCNSDVFNHLGCCSALGYGGNFENSLGAVYQFAAIGRSMSSDEIVELHNFFNNYLTGLPTNDVGVFA